MPGAAVSVTQGSRSWRTVTDQRGRYAFENLPGGEFRLALTKAKFAPVGSHIQISPGACLVLRSYFRTQSTISGIALDANGRPLPGLDLGLYQVQDDGRLRNLGNYVRAGPDGRFMLENIPTGPVIIGANVNRVPNDFEPFDPVFATSPTNAGGGRVFSLDPRQHVTNAVLRMLPPLRYGQLFVEVKWADGTPATGARAFAKVGAQESTHATAPSGSSRVALSLPLGRAYHIYADWQFWNPPRTLRVDGPTAELVAFQHDGQTITIRLHGKKPATPP
ncbi:MAG: carboxypeptidase-like regulatory domain-containing protein [Bryobacteraceae bacterium]|nr:carboxypeptidase-like regulatory domain-containing protein [Bryobacteraceae bacterium]